MLLTSDHLREQKNVNDYFTIKSWFVANNKASAITTRLEVHQNYFTIFIWVPVIEKLAA